MEFVLSFFLLGLLGGALPDLLRVVKNRDDLSFTMTPGFWVGLVILIGLGGLAAWLGQAETEVAALAMGFGAPEVLSRLVGATSGDSAESESDDAAAEAEDEGQPLQGDALIHKASKAQGSPEAPKAQREGLLSWWAS